MKNENLSSEELKKYASGKLSDKDANRVERTLLDQPLYADAIEGFEVLDADKIDTNDVNLDLKNRLYERVQVGKTVHTPTQIIPLWQKASVAASIILLIGLGFYFFNKSTENQEVSINQSTKKEKIKQDEVPVIKENSNENLAKKTETKKPTRSQNIEEKEILQSNDSFENKSISDKKAEVENEDLVLSESPPPILAEKPKYAEVRSREADKEEDSKEKVTAAPVITSETARMGISTISGTVVDEEKEPMSGVAIHLKGTTKTARTNEKGLFFIDGLRKGNVLVLNFNDMPTQEIAVSNPLVGQIVYSENSGRELETKVKKKADPFGSNEFIDTRPENGWTVFQDYVKENLKMPQQATEKGIKGKVGVKFKVSEDGVLSDFKITKSLGFGCDEEAIRLISEGPKWFPAFRFGKKINTTTTVMIKFE
jgi:TonB family protein